jgi:hypothetical protein
MFSPETLTPEVLTKLGAPPRNPDIPTITAEDMKQFDGFAFGSESSMIHHTYVKSDPCYD